MKIKIIFSSLIIFSVLCIVVGSNSLAVYATIDNELDWTTYKNSEYGISIDYPNYYNIHEAPSETSLHDMAFISSDVYTPDLGVFRLVVYPNTMTLQEFIDKDIVNDDGIGNYKIVEDINPITISDNISGLSYGTVNNNPDKTLNRNVVFNTDDYIFHFVYIDTKDDFHDNVYDHIIESITVTKE